VIVVDASVLTDFLLGRPPAMNAVLEALEAREQEPLHAPDLIEPETLNALRGLARGGKITDRRATEAAADLGNARLIRYPHGPLRDRVWELRGNLTAYDACYLALAEALGDCVLLTGDAGLAESARASLGDSRVRYVQ
jgi:predicted nucleic acid-binding protein